MNALTTKTIETREESVISSMSAEQSLDVRDAFVKVKKNLRINLENHT